MKLDIDETVPNLGKSIPAICGQLVCVDQINRAQCIHQTFLLHTYILIWRLTRKRVTIELPKFVLNS